MNVSCPQCKTVFRVDPRKVPAEGVRARCSVCGGVFEVLSEEQVAEKAAAVAAPPPPPPPPPPMPPPPPPPEPVHVAPVEREPVAMVPPAAPEPEIAVPAVEPADEPDDLMPPAPQEPEPVLEPEAPAEVAPLPPPPQPSAPAPPPAPPPPTPKPVAGFKFGQPDQDARAQRLARALISDLAAYHPDRQEKGLKEGRLKELFQEELRKSWQEYVDQVGLEVARSTPYFRDALNEILARGKRVF